VHGEGEGRALEGLGLHGGNPEQGRAGEPMPPVIPAAARKKKAGRPALDKLAAGRIGPALRQRPYFSVLDEDGTVT
jgi:hypothetical protein